MNQFDIPPKEYSEIIDEIDLRDNAAIDKAEADKQDEQEEEETNFKQY